MTNRMSGVITLPKFIANAINQVGKLDKNDVYFCFQYAALNGATEEEMQDVAEKLINKVQRELREPIKKIARKVYAAEVMPLINELVKE